MSEFLIEDNLVVSYSTLIKGVFPCIDKEHIMY